MSAGLFQEPHPQSLCCIAMRCAVSYRAAYFSCKICVIVWTWIRMPAMEQAVQENRSITKRESTIRLFAAIFLAALLLFLLGFRSVGFKTAQVIFFGFGDGVGCGLHIVLTGMFLHTYLNSDTFWLSSIALDLKFLGSKLFTFRKLEAMGSRIDTIADKWTHSIAFPTVSRG